MCRHLRHCTLLGEDPTSWDKHVPLPHPPWFREEIVLFHAAAIVASRGDRVGATQVLTTIRSDEARDWLVEHGQVSGTRRVRGLNSVAPQTGTEFDPVRNAPRELQRRVFQRDSYTCRYCGLRQVSMEVLRAFERVVGTTVFRTVGTNAQQHGVVHAFKIVADHVVPHCRGGRTDMDNLVSACAGCNYGKASYTVGELAITDPRDRPPCGDDWDGMLALLPGLKRHASRT